MKEKIANWLYSNGDKGKIINKIGMIGLVWMFILLFLFSLVSCGNNPDYYVVTGKRIQYRTEFMIEVDGGNYVMEKIITQRDWEQIEILDTIPKDSPLW
jgi:hypothetical protein